MTQHGQETGATPRHALPPRAFELELEPLTRGAAGA